MERSGGWLYYTVADRDAIYKVPLDGGHPIHVLNVYKGSKSVIRDIVVDSEAG